MKRCEYKHGAWLSVLASTEDSGVVVLRELVVSRLEPPIRRVTTQDRTSYGDEYLVTGERRPVAGTAGIHVPGCQGRLRDPVADKSADHGHQDDGDSATATVVGFGAHNTRPLSRCN